MTTPLMEQYYNIKDQHPDEIVLFHLGDFYEVFEEDAEIVSRELEITLTSRFQGDDEVPMAGVPIQKAEPYISRLLNKGYRVAICDQVEDADQASGLVDREVVRVITPGTLTEEEYLTENQNNYLVSLYMDGEDGALSWVDLSTGVFHVEELAAADLLDEIARLDPAECIHPETMLERDDDFLAAVEETVTCMVTPVPDWTFEEETAYETLVKQFGTTLLDGFGIRDYTYGIQAAGSLLEYLQETQKGNLEHIKRITPFDRENTMILDQVSQRSLELTRTLRTGEEEGSLIHLLDQTTTAMGGRLLRRWLLAPLKNKTEIENRQEAVEYLVEDYTLRNELTEQLKNVYDIERITSKLGSGRANPRNLVSLRTSLQMLPELRELLASAEGKLARIRDQMNPLEGLTELLEESMRDSPPAVLTDGGIIREGFDEELDELREMKTSGKNWMAEFEEQERERTGIDSLKVGHNKVHGYYIQVTKTHTDQVPDAYNRKQTLKNAERYITPELKEKESQLFNAEERIKELEYNLFLELRTEASKEIQSLQQTAAALAEMDGLCSLATVAEEKGWRKPEIVEEPRTKIREGRHPVVESLQEERFVPNHTDLDSAEDRLLMITGPNMAGKSTYIRQVGILTVLAQIGSFVPARRATIGIVDQLFTRVGASDELTRGASTFMVEMTETANILNNATKHSLVILDEVGRGTSTSDGISIAQSVCEHMHDRVGARSLFATHYQELSTLEETLPGVKNYHFGVQETDGEIVFQRKLKEGACDRSYGIHVAELAGVPEPVVNRAAAILKKLEEQKYDIEKRRENLTRSAEQAQQMSLFASGRDRKKVELAEEIESLLENLNLNHTTPVEALQVLQDLMELVEEKKKEVELDS